MKKNKETIYQITLNEHQLRLISACVEDCSRFAAGQMELYNTTCYADNMHELQEELNKLQSFMTPHLSRGSSYDWAGNHCPNKRQRKFIAETYYLYREILHQLTMQNKPIIYSVYNHETLRCADSGEPIKIEKL